MRRDEQRPWDWMLDGVAPLLGWYIAVVIFLSVMNCLE
jgi:hypothetical protein